MARLFLFVEHGQGCFEKTGAISGQNAIKYKKGYEADS